MLDVDAPFITVTQMERAYAQSLDSAAARASFWYGLYHVKMCYPSKRCLTDTPLVDFHIRLGMSDAFLCISMHTDVASHISLSLTCKSLQSLLSFDDPVHNTVAAGIWKDKVEHLVLFFPVPDHLDGVVFRPQYIAMLSTLRDYYLSQLFQASDLNTREYYLFLDKVVFLFVRLFAYSIIGVASYPCICATCWNLFQVEDYDLVFNSQVF